MCIVCEIKNALEKEAPSKEGRAYILQRVEMLAAVASHCHDVVCDVLDGKPQSRAKLEEMRVLGAFAFNDAPDALEQREAMLAEAEAHEEAVSGIGEALAELLGGNADVSVSVHRVELGEGESISDAIKRTLEANEASFKAFTKH